MPVTKEQILEVNPHLTEEEVAFIKKDINKPNAVGKMENADAIRKMMEQQNLVSSKYKYVVHSSAQGINAEIKSSKNDDPVEVLRNIFAAGKESGFGFQNVKEHVIINCGFEAYILLAKFREVFKIRFTSDIGPMDINVVRGK